MTECNIIDARCQFGAVATSVSLETLVSCYEQIGISLASLANQCPNMKTFEAECSQQEGILLSRQQRVVERIAGHEITSNSDMVKVLEVWRSEAVENDNLPNTSERLVLSVLNALRKRG